MPTAPKNHPEALGKSGLVGLGAGGQNCLAWSGGVGTIIQILRIQILRSLVSNAIGVVAPQGSTNFHWHESGERPFAHRFLTPSSISSLHWRQLDSDRSVNSAKYERALEETQDVNSSVRLHAQIQSDD